MPKTSAVGHLISVDAIRGRDLIPSARHLLQAKKHDGRDGGFSLWDASSIFYELHEIHSNGNETPSVQTMMLLFAADLRFRLRWQIEPALQEGQTVIAAPYVETGIAFGLALGLSKQWLTELFRFAPKSKTAFWVGGNPPALHLLSANGRKRDGERKPSGRMAGFIEFCSSDLPISAEFFAKFAAHFDDLERRGKCRRLS